MSDQLEDDDSLESMSVSQSNGTLRGVSSRRGSPHGDFGIFTSPLVGRGVQRMSVIGPETGEMTRMWMQKRVSIAPHALQQNSAPQMMEYLEDRRRRASRVVGTPTILLQEEDNNNIESITAELHELREEVEKQRNYIIEMADIGQGLVVEIDDLRSNLLEADNERELSERKSDSQRAEIEELQLANNRLKQELLSEEAAHSIPTIENINQKIDQTSVIQNLRRSQLTHDRIERARSLLAITSESPIVVEECFRTQIENEMNSATQRILFWFLDESRYQWRTSVSDSELMTLSMSSMRQQLSKVLEARLRAESLATQHGDIAEDLRRSVNNKNAAIKQLQSKLTATRVSHYVKTDLTPTVVSALEKVHSLKSVITNLPTSPTSTEFHTPARQINATRHFNTL